MTILPPRTVFPHECDTPAPLRRDVVDAYIPAHEDGTLWECPVCGRWWKCRHVQGFVRPRWLPVRWYDVKARRHIAAHETEKMHYRVPTTAMSTLHWWDCHPNPNRGRP